MSANTVTLVVAGMGIVGTLLAPLLTAWMNQRQEQRKWARDRRFDAYVTFMAQAEELKKRAIERHHDRLFARAADTISRDKLDQMLNHLEAHMQQLDSFIREHNEIKLLGSKRIRQAAKELYDEVMALGTLDLPDDSAGQEALLATHNLAFADRFTTLQDTVRREMGLNKL